MLMETKYPREFMPYYGELDHLPITNNSVFVDEASGKEYAAKTFCNGHYKEEGASVEGFGADSVNEADELTLDCINKIKAEHEIVAVRKLPYLEQWGDKYYMFMRLAF
jgi:hypothetical protein